MRMVSAAFFVALILSLVACVSIPPGAPELSAQLGVRISSMESAHNYLLKQFFSEKRRQVDDFLQKAWVPVFAKEFFDDPKIQTVWNQVVASDNPDDRLRFITIVGPALQNRIAAKRVELIQPLDELEGTIRDKLRSEYDQMRAINFTLTAFLQSAAKVEENRKRYLEMIGITDKGVDKFIDETDKAVSRLIEVSGTVQNLMKGAESFRENIQGILEKLNK